MRKTEYDSYVLTYVTTEERCALRRLINEVEYYMIKSNDGVNADIEKMRMVSISDISTLHDLVDFTYNDPPDKVCKSTEVTDDIRKIQRIKETL